MAENIKKLDLESKDLVAERVAEMRDLFPEVFSEGGIDFEKLRLVLGDEVEDGDERYTFTWPGKRNAIRQSQMRSTATLRPCPEQSVNWDSTQNLYIEGDNLEVLKLLQRAYSGQIKMIYIDPPYNTGKDFVYKDDLTDSIENYKQQTSQTAQANPETAGRFHANWCSMIYPRLRLARDLLTEDGVLVSSIGIQEAENLQRICRELFPTHQVVLVTVQTSGGKPSGGFTLLNEYLVFVVPEGFTPNGIDRLGGTARNPYEGLTLSTFNKIQRPNQAYPVFVDPTTMRIVGRGKSLAERIEDGDYAGTKATFSYDYGEAPEGTVALWPITAKGKECVWRLIPERLEADWKKGYIRVSLNTSVACPNRFSLQYLPVGVISKVESGELEIVGKEDNGVTLVFGDNSTVGSQIPSILIEKDYYTSKGTSQLKELFNSDNAPFDYSKPVELLSDLVNLCTNDGDTVLDFFSGSATTAHALMKQDFVRGINRHWIMVQLPERCDSDTAAAGMGYRTICDVGIDRIRLAGKQVIAEADDKSQQPRLGEEPKRLPDVGFRVLRLDDSGIAEARGRQYLINRVKPDRSDEDIIFEMMLKWGLELTYPVEKTEVAGYPCYTVAGDALICCMAKGLSVDVIEAIADREPDRVFILDSVLDDSLKLNALQAFKRVEERSQHNIDLRTV